MSNTFLKYFICVVLSETRRKDIKEREKSIASEHVSLYVLREGAEMAETWRFSCVTDSVFSLNKRLSSVEWEEAGIMKSQMNIWHSCYREQEWR